MTVLENDSHHLSAGRVPLKQQQCWIAHTVLRFIGGKESCIARPIPSLANKGADWFNCTSGFSDARPLGNEMKLSDSFHINPGIRHWMDHYHPALDSNQCPRKVLQPGRCKE